MRDFNPTSQQGPEEEPLNNRTLNPRHQANTAPYHTHMPTAAGRRLTEHTCDTDTKQITDRSTCFARAVSASWPRVEAEWYRSKCPGCQPSSGSGLHTTVSYLMDAMK